jgi:hypothetical protein
MSLKGNTNEKSVESSLPPFFGSKIIREGAERAQTQEMNRGFMFSFPIRFSPNCLCLGPQQPLLSC